MIEEKDLIALNALIALMETSPVFTKEQLKTISDEDRVRLQSILERMLLTGENYGQASGAPDFLNQPYEDFRLHLKKTDNLLNFQTKVVWDAFNLYLKSGETPAPYYALRIAIILSKAKMKDKEKQFLSAWSRHFSSIRSSSGSTYGLLNHRARKLGVVVTDNI